MIRVEHCWAALRTLTIFLSMAAIGRPAAAAPSWTVIGWNNLGMHCMDGDYSVFSLLPPFNTIQAQLIDAQGHLVRDPGGITVTYEAVADPDGSINTTSSDKTNFWDHVLSLFGVTLDVDVGLAGQAMPGAANRPQPMIFDAQAAAFVATGIPITPYDDQRHKNPYPLMRLVARDTSGTPLATTDIVLPVSDEMDCTTCHASDSNPAARPVAGWVHDQDPQRDMRLNILRLHDDREGATSTFRDALAAANYNTAGLFVTATTDHTSVLCARCHLSEALAGSGLPGIEPLTRAIHQRMSYVLDPVTGLPLDATANRSACYRCHPGSVTRCLRGAMGSAVASNGSLAMQCQNCHGSMHDLASPDRTGWLNEPVCQSCHTGTATHNNGAIRYTSAFEDSGAPRQAVDATFATTPDVPAAGYSLYRFSTGHGGLACEACHGSTHAEFPSSHRNDNLQSMAHQGHVGMLVECEICHGTPPTTIDGGPHGMHPVGQTWVDIHPSLFEGEGNGGGAAVSPAQCQTCHGTNDRGTVLSRAQGERTIVTEEAGTKHFWRGFQIGCYTCHLGPANGDRNPNRPAQASDGTATTAPNTPVTIQLHASNADADTLTLRLVTQPSNGTVGLDGTQATYFPAAAFTGTDSFTFAAWDGSTDSNLASVVVTVACVGDCNTSGEVTVDELIHGINMALGDNPVSECAVFDSNHDGLVTVDELLQAINVALSGCGSGG